MVVIPGRTKFLMQCSQLGLVQGGGAEETLTESTEMWGEGPGMGAGLYERGSWLPLVGSWEDLAGCGEVMGRLLRSR